MSSWRQVLNGAPLPWLLEPDPVQPGVRYFTLRALRVIKAAYADLEGAGA